MRWIPFFHYVLNILFIWHNIQRYNFRISMQCWNDSERMEGCQCREELRKSNSCPDTQKIIFNSIPGTRKSPPKSHIIRRIFCLKKYDFISPKGSLITSCEGWNRLELKRTIPMILLNVMTMLTELFCVLAVNFFERSGPY